VDRQGLCAIGRSLWPKVGYCSAVGFYLRKALRAGPLRFNLSKHGLGVSVGVPGFRVGLIGPRGHYVQMGRKGLYYRSTLGARQPSAVHQVTRSYHQPAVAPPQSYDIQEPSKPIMQDVTGATVLQMAASTPSVLVEQLTGGGPAHDDVVGASTRRQRRRGTGRSDRVRTSRHHSGSGARSGRVVAAAARCRSSCGGGVLRRERTSTPIGTKRW